MAYWAPMISTSDPVTSLLADARDRADRRLDSWATRVAERQGGMLGDAVAYALRSPGKRIRAALALASYRWAGGTSDGIDGVLAALETVHAYSLVHDDLPCMDDDDLRRGRPTTHRAFDVETATRAGFLLVPVAAEVLAEAADELGLSATVLGRMASELFRASGVEGMVGGQWLDLEAEGRTLSLDELVQVHRGKTGALIRASCLLGGQAAAAPEPALSALGLYGERIGLAFQIADDMLDSTGTSETLGKTAGKDREAAKATYASVLGLDAARAEADRLAAEAVASLEGGRRAETLAGLARYIVNRSS